MLVPLRTLPGFPTVENPSLLSELVLFLGLPLVVVAVIYLLGYLSRLIRRGRGETGPEIQHPLSIYGLETPEQYEQLVTGRSGARALER